MLVSEFKTGNVPPLPTSLADTDDINQYIINLVAHAYYTGIEIDNRDHNGKPRQRRLYSFEVLEFPKMRFSIRIPTRHRYRLENRGLPKVQSTTINNNHLVSNNSLISN